jgi:16S rRNA processing protein RimM
VHKTTDYLIIGKVSRSFGIGGEIKLVPITDRGERFKELEYLYVREGDGYRGLRIERTRIAGDKVILKLEGVSTREEADQLRHQLLYVDREHAAELEEDSYYYYDILGCTVETTTGENLGVVRDIQNFGSCDIYFVQRTDGEEMLIPAIRDVIADMDLSRKRIVIEPVDGLLE